MEEAPARCRFRTCSGLQANDSFLNVFGHLISRARNHFPDTVMLNVLPHHGHVGLPGVLGPGQRSAAKLPG